MNVGQLKKLLNKIDDDVEIINQITMEQGRGCNGGVDYSPYIKLCKPGEMEHSFCDLDDDEVEGWEYNEEEGLYTNTETWLVIKGDCEEDWYE